MSEAHLPKADQIPAGLPELRPQIGGFTLLEKLYDGSISTVYKARQDRLGRVVALKLLAEYPPPSDVVLERFNRATYVNAQVVHPNLVVLYESGTRDGYHFSALEYVPGQTVQELLHERGRLSERRSVHIGWQVARALCALHERGILHRNLKPKNILLDPNGRVKLVGLGLAKCDAACFSRNLDAQTIGTPHFMAPEMIRGYTADPRSDLYGLGATLYALVSGRPPFDRGLPAAVMAKHLYEQPKPLNEVVPGLGGEFAALVMQLMAKEPAMRPGSAREVAERLEKLAERNPYVEERRAWVAVASKRGVAERLLSFPRAGLFLATLTVVFVTGLAAFGAWWALSSRDGRPASPAPAEAVPPPAVAPGTDRASAPDASAARMVEEFKRLVAQEAQFRREGWRGVSEWSAFLRVYPTAPEQYRAEAFRRLNQYRQIEMEKPRPGGGQKEKDLEF